MFLLRQTLTHLVRPRHIHHRRIAVHLQRRFESSSSSSNDKSRKEEEAEEELEKQLMVHGSFEHIKTKNRKTYLDMIRVFENKDKHRRNHVEFIYAALKNMEHFSVHRDVEVYKALIDVMPKGKMVATNMWQVEFMHYPKQQQCIIDLLEQMEDNGVMPDYEMEDMLVNIFGRRAHPLLKFWRMMYWMPKFKNLTPWPLPAELPDEALELAKLAVERMCTVDLNSRVTVYETRNIEAAVDDTWVVSGQSPEQQSVLKRRKNDLTALRIEGPFFLWLRNQTVDYFVLMGDPPPKRAEPEEDPDDVSDLPVPLLGTVDPIKEAPPKKSVHEQDEGTIFAICATGTSSQDSLLSWIRSLEKDGNPDLADLPVMFKLRRPATEVTTTEGKKTIEPGAAEAGTADSER